MSIPQWLVPNGSGPFSVSISPITVDTSGKIESKAEHTLTGVIDSIDIRTRSRVENISPMNRRLVNYVVIDRETSFTLVEILKSKGTNFLASIAVNSSYAMISLTRGEQTWSFVGLVGEYTEKIRRGKSCAALSIVQADIESVNPEYK